MGMSVSRYGHSAISASSWPYWTPRKPPGDNVVYLIRCNADELPDTAAFARELPADDLRRANGYVHDRVRRTFLTSRWVLRSVLGGMLEVPAADLVFDCSLYGKPRLQHPARLEFNVSHSAGEVLIGITAHCRIGVDVEQIRKDLTFDDIVADYFSPVEQHEFRRIAPAHRRAAFFAGWTRKEAFIKAVGEGVSYGLDNFDVTLDPFRPPRLLRTRGEDTRGWVLRSVPYRPGYAAACAVESAGAQIHGWEFRLCR